MAPRAFNVTPKRISRKQPSFTALLGSRVKNQDNPWIPVFQSAVEADGLWVCVELDRPDIESARYISRKINRGTMKIVKKGEFQSIYDSAHVWVRLKNGERTGGYELGETGWDNPVIQTVGDLIAEYDTQLGMEEG